MILMCRQFNSMFFLDQFNYYKIIHEQFQINVSEKIRICLLLQPNLLSRNFKYRAIEQPSFVPNFWTYNENPIRVSIFVEEPIRKLEMPTDAFLSDNSDRSIIRILP